MYVDRDRRAKIVVNLISNAFKFNLAGEIEVRLRESASSVELVVRDTGIGIPQDIRAHELWEIAWRPEGRDDQFWHQAKRELMERPTNNPGEKSETFLE